MNYEPPRAACAGMSDLFEATDTESHRKARAICRQCDISLECKALARTLREKEGTWAGQLYGRSYNNPPVRQMQIHPNDADYTEDEARKCATAYSNGIRDDYTRIGKQVYKRRMYRARREAERGAA